MAHDEEDAAPPGVADLRNIVDRLDLLMRSADGADAAPIVDGRSALREQRERIGVLEHEVGELRTLVGHLMTIATWQAKVTATLVGDDADVRSADDPMPDRGAPGPTGGWSGDDRPRGGDRDVPSDHAAGGRERFRGLDDGADRRHAVERPLNGGHRDAGLPDRSAHREARGGRSHDAVPRDRSRDVTSRGDDARRHDRGGADPEVADRRGGPVSAGYAGPSDDDADDRPLPAPRPRARRARDRPVLPALEDDIDDILGGAARPSRSDPPPDFGI